mgnify:FL=1
MENCQSWYLYSPKKWGTQFWGLLFFLDSLLMQFEDLKSILYLIPCSQCRDNALELIKQVSPNLSLSLVRQLERYVTTKIHSKTNCTAPVDGLVYKQQEKFYTKVKKYENMAKSLPRYWIQLENTIACKINRENVKHEIHNEVLNGINTLCLLLQKKNISCNVLESKKKL